MAHSFISPYASPYTLVPLILFAHFVAPASCRHLRVFFSSAVHPERCEGRLDAAFVAPAYCQRLFFVKATLRRHGGVKPPLLTWWRVQALLSLPAQRIPPPPAFLTKSAELLDGKGFVK